MASDPKKKAFLEGYERGLREAWAEIASLMTRPYSAMELKLMAKSKLAVIHGSVEAMADKIGSEAPESRGEIGGRGSYLVREEKAEAVLREFAKLLDRGARGLSISRMHPRDLAARFRGADVEYVWLSRTAGRDGEEVVAAEPTDLVRLASHIVAFLGARKGAAVLLEGLEYLVSLNGFPSVLRFLQSVNEKVLLADAFLVISVNPAALKANEYQMLAKEMAGEV